MDENLDEKVKGVEEFVELTLGKQDLESRGRNCDYSIPPFRTSCALLGVSADYDHCSGCNFYKQID